MHEFDLIIMLTACFAAALLLGYATHRMGLSPIAGYLIAGIALGPHTPGFVANRELAEQLAEIGVILLMFGVGLHFNIRELLVVRRVAIPGAIVQSLTATALGAWLAHLCGWEWTAGIVFGLAISVASTVVLVRVLSDRNALHTPTGHIAVGWLVVEDLLTVVILVLLPALFGGGGQASGNFFTAVSVGLTMVTLKVGALTAAIFVIGGRVIPKVLGHAAATRSRELFTLTVLVVALGIAVGSAKLFDVSMALGAFLAGMVVGRSEFSLRAASEALPMRDAFAVLFFISIGMLFRPGALIESPGLFAGTLAIILLGKPMAALAIVLVMRYPMKVAIGVAVALAQIGEFSFLLASVGSRLKILPDVATDALVASAIVSITLSPLFYRLVGPFDRFTQRSARISGWLKQWSRRESPAALPPDSHRPETGARYRAVVVGYGPVGRTVHRLLRENGIEPTLIEMNIETVRKLKEEGMRAVYGNASHRETLAEAGVESAGSLILSADMEESPEAIRLARELNPRIRILARSSFLKNVESLRRAGAQVVFSGEVEVALGLTEAILRDLGATPEQIDRERERVHASLLAGPGRGGERT